ncbi:MAG TPA: hypothetical protein VJ890_10240, partial [Vineibacter sp.]|nr:hypothetical protein [Vineibacter sp.]
MSGSVDELALTARDVRRAPRRRPMAVLGVTLAVALGSSAAWAQKPAPEAAKPAGASAGQTRAGEPCVYRPVNADPTIAARAAYDIVCGKALDPSARVYQLDGAQPAANLVPLASGGPWRTYLEGRARCGTPASATIGGAPA